VGSARSLAFTTVFWIGFACFVVVVLAGIVWAWRRSDAEQDRRG
jgi:hypothetical protein